MQKSYTIFDVLFVVYVFFGFIGLVYFDLFYGLSLYCKSLVKALDKAKKIWDNEFTG